MTFLRPSSPVTAALDNPRRRGWRRAAWAGAGAIILAAGGALYVAVLLRTTPGPDALRRAQAARPSVILSSDGEVIGRFATSYQAPVPLKEVPQALVDALVATEDRRFYQHGGIDPQRILGSVWGILHGRMEGGSTLTQQLARNLFPQQIGNRASLDRKLREAITALRLERTSSKAQILESYLNVVPFLYNVHGVDMAARTYFGKPVGRLDTAECATLVAMLKGSDRYNPVRNPERARTRRNLVLAQMVRNGSLTPARYQSLAARPLDLAFRPPEDGGIGQARHFVAWLHERLVEWADAHDLDLDTGGLVIRTTLDARLQRLAQDAVVRQTAFLQQAIGDEWRSTRRVGGDAGPFGEFWRTHPALLTEMARQSPEFRARLAAGRGEAEALADVLADAPAMARLRDEKTRLSAGLVAIDPATGALRAWVGSPDFAREQFDHVAQARRQPGSTFKPFVYGAALQRGLSPAHRYLDGDVEIPLGDGGVWRPTDAGGPSGEWLTMRQGLALSKNTITAQVMQEVGAEAVVGFARAAGVRDSPLDPVPSLALGTSPVTLLEIGDAYATLAGLGVRHAPLAVLQIEDRDGRVLERFEAPAEPALDRPLVERLVDMLRGVTGFGTGAGIRSAWGVKGDLAGKTGTTQANTDGWFMLMNPTLVTGAWVGFDDPRVTMRSDRWGQGGRSALRLVGQFWKAGQQARLIDAKAVFPSVEPDAPDGSESPDGAVPASDVAASAPVTPSDTAADIEKLFRLPPRPLPTASEAAEAARVRDQAIGR